MKRFLFGFLAVLFLILNTIPYLHILADDMPTSSQYEMLGAYALSTLITSGEATELDFSDYTETDTSFLIDLGEAIFTGDWSGLAEDGLEWLGETADSVYDSYKEYISQWKSDHLGLMYSYWFPDEEIYVGPDDSYSLAKPLRELFTPRNNDSPNPSPDPDYSFINNINQLIDENVNIIGSSNFGAYQNGGWDAFSLKHSSNSVTYIYSNLIDFHNINHVGYVYASIVYPVMTISLTNNGDNTYTATYTSSTPDSLFPWSTHPNWRFNYLQQYDSIESWGQSFTFNTYTQSNFAGLSTAINYIYQHYANINLYVDNVPWVIVSNNEPTYPIIIPGQLTIWNSQPLEYSFPADTHIDLPDLTTIIRNAINSSGVVMWSDIADVFVDVNGLTAVAVTKIVRNDYDNLYMEQYPYPAMLVGMTDQTKFNEHLLDNSHAYLSPMGTVVQETVNVLPSELVGVLAIGAILTIFAVIINRLLE